MGVDHRAMEFIGGDVNHGKVT